MSELQNKGYTLIELLVGMIIMSILFSIGYASFRKYSRRQVLVSFTRKVKGDLSLAREMSISGEKPNNVFCDSPNTLSGYNFKIISNQSYKVEALCSGGTVEIKDVDVQDDLSFVSYNSIFFKVLSKGTNLSSDIEVQIIQESTGNISSIYITKSGEIK
ncbi:prepilin-type N-terminal cleavage/methylation domain-containing protein [Patescibacteria group bacterium]|nr:prepilin-type N-terminal cleavage/methylation domain-containing protein [Patescibacteria group bacterium]MBU2036267.1 prepilin-type N-terminal cleavage/methylation domain-containing protein [Patescibacteria group bacterium]